MNLPWFNYSPMRKAIDQITEAAISLGCRTASLESRCAVLEKETASAEIQRWQTGQIKDLQDRLKALEVRTQPPVGLDETPGTTARECILAYAGFRQGEVKVSDLIRDLSKWHSEIAIRTAAKRCADCGELTIPRRGVYALPKRDRLNGYGDHPSVILSARSVGQRRNG